MAAKGPERSNRITYTIEQLRALAASPLSRAPERLLDLNQPALTIIYSYTDSDQEDSDSVDDTISKKTKAKP